MGFIIYTWNQYTRKIDSENYAELINFFGNFSWTAVVFSIMAGFTIDLFARFINNLYQILRILRNLSQFIFFLDFSLLQKCNFSMNQGRTIATLMFVGLDNIIAVILNILLLLWTNTGRKLYSKYSRHIIFNPHAPDRFTFK